MTSFFKKLKEQGALIVNKTKTLGSTTEKQQGVDFLMSYDKPPIYDNVVSMIGDNVSLLKTIFTYGDIIFNPNELNLTPDIVAHEKVHMDQQGHNNHDAALWWGRYLREPEFRLDQESKAYTKQYEWFCQHYKDRNQRAVYLNGLAKTLSSPLYGNLITQSDAYNLIKRYAKV
jgi:hypothetical protein